MKRRGGSAAAQISLPSGPSWATAGDPGAIVVVLFDVVDNDDEKYVRLVYLLLFAIIWQLRYYRRMEEPCCWPPSDAVAALCVVY